MKTRTQDSEIDGRLVIAISIAVLISFHSALFLLLPLALAARLAVKPRPATLDVAKGVLRFCLGFGKGVLLIDPLWHLSALIAHGGVEGLSRSTAWTSFLALLLSIHFIFTAAGDVLAGLGGMLGLAVPEAVQESLTLRRFTQGKFSRLLPLLVVLAALGILLQSASVSLAGQHFQAMFVPPVKTITAAIQEARVLTDFHVVTLLAGFACLLGLPHSRDFLRTAAPWKAVVCLSIFLLATAMLWTRTAPMP